jgi:hypothetical protein
MEAGKQYVVCVRQLRAHFGEPTIPETKEGSYRWANRWWQERSARPAAPEPTGPLLRFEDRRSVDNPLLADYFLVSAFEERGLPLPP